MALGWIGRSPSSDDRTPRRGWRLWLVLLFFAGCGGQEAYGEANVLLCRTQGSEGCAEDSSDHLVQPALFSRTWSRFEQRGVAVMVDFAVDAGDGTTRRALLWLDVDLGDLPPGVGGGLSRELWAAEYSERSGDETLFAGRSVEGSIVVAEQLLLDGQPPALRLNVELRFRDHDGVAVQLDGVIATHEAVRDLDGQGERPQGYTATDDDYCYDCRYGCGGLYVEDDHSSDGGCGGDDTSSSDDSGGGCEGDTTDSSYSSDSGGGCESDSSDSDLGCEGDAHAASTKRTRRLPRLSLPRVLDLVFPIAIGVLLRCRRRR